MHIFISGGTRGIGLGMVKEFLKKGHQVSYTGTSLKSIELHKEELKGSFEPIICDVRSKNQIIKAKEEAIKKFNDIDIWINNAGVDQEHLVVSDLSEEEIKRVIDINVVGMMLGTSVALKQMKKQNHGFVYNMEGLGSNNMKIPKTLIYGSSKRLLTYFSQGCNMELKEYDNIHVGTMQPGMVFTDLLLRNMTDDGMKIARILGSEVEVVTPFLVKKALAGKKTIKFLTTSRVIWRFLTRSFKRNYNHQ
jgi:NADP-dependent 3-hydroxy acid dehydrogenase YdfG